MQTWLRISLLLCTFGFFREMRPSEPFVTMYLTEEWGELTSEIVNKEIFPFGTYAMLAQLVIVFLITDMLRYKPIIVVSAIAGIVVFAFLIWTKTVTELKICQVVFGTFMASEVAYYTYIYAKVEKSRYQVVTGHTRAAILCGKFLGGVFGQILISTEATDYRGLHFISFGSQIVSLFVALLLPSVGRSLYFYVADEKVAQQTAQLQLAPPAKEISSSDTIEDAPFASSLAIISVATKHDAEGDISTAIVKPRFSWRHAFHLLWQHAVSAYTNPVVVQWSCWWAVATCGQLQVVSYAQFLWKEIDPNHENFYNGAVEATVTLLGAAGAMAAGQMNSSRHRNWHIWILTICSLLMGAFIIISAVTNLIWVAYVMYVLFGIFYFFVITIASAIVAGNLSDDSFGLIFGINTLVALALQTILTLVVVTDTVGYGLAPRGQYVVYGSYFVVLAALYGLAVIVRYVWCKSSSESPADSNSAFGRGLTNVEFFSDGRGAENTLPASKCTNHL